MKLLNTLYLMLIAVVVSVGSLNAQNIILGTGTLSNTNTTASPINIFYRSLRYQTVYTAAEIQAAGGAPGQILQMGWFVTGVPLYSMPNYTISMKHTTATNAAAHDGTGLQQVYNNPLYTPVAGGWDMLTLQNPFVWNGVDNILVDVCFDMTNPTWNSSGQVRVYTATSGGRFSRSDATNQCGLNTATTLGEKPQVNFFLQSGPPPTCPMLPATLTATNITAASANINWTPNGTPQSFLLEYGPSGFLPGTGTSASTTNTTYTVQGLAPITDYTVRVRQVCGTAVGDTSYARTVNFTTPCAIFNAPFFENFDGATTPGCWSQSAVTGGPWVFTGSPDYLATGTVSVTADGSSFAWMDFSVPDDDVVLATPQINISALSSPVLSFWFKSVPTPNEPTNILRVEAYNGTSWQVVASLQQNSPNWEYKVFNLSPYVFNGNLVQVRFVADTDPAQTGSYFYNDLMIDDVRVDGPPAFDATVTEFLAPYIGGCNVLTNSETVTVKIANYGSNTLTTANISMRVNGVLVASGVFNGTLLPNATTNFTFPNGVNLATQGQLTIKVKATATPQEDIPFNDEVTFIRYNDGNNIINNYPYSQSFDTWNICLSNCVDGGCGTFGLNNGWRNSIGDDDSDWSVGTGVTPTANTGPLGDNTSGTGKYLYTEAAGCTDFYLITPCFNLSSIPNPELSFYYNMFGPQTGTLTVELDNSGQGNWVQLWTLSGPQGNTWQKASIDLTAYAGTTAKFRFKVAAGATTSDIAIDDILVRNVPPHDLQITNVVGPLDDCGDENVFIDVTVFNYGGAVEGDYTVTVNQTGLTTNSVSQNITVALNPEDSTVVSVGPFNTALGGTVNYAASVVINNATDVVPSNNSGAYQHKAYALSYPQGIDATTCGFSDVTLGATGIATEFFWFADSTSTEVLATGTTFDLTNVQADTTLWIEGRAPFTDFAFPLNNTFDEGGHYDYYPDGLVFNALYDITIESVKVYPLAQGDIVVNIEDAQGNVIYTTTYTHLTTASQIRIPMGALIPAGNGYKMNATGSTTQLYRNKNENTTTGVAYPYTLGDALVITKAINDLPDAYYFFYNWEVTFLGCPSERVPATAFLGTSGLTANFTVQDENLPTQGAVTTNMVGGAAPYTFSWSNGATSANISNLISGTYQVTVADANGCTDTFSVFVDYTVGTNELKTVSELDIFPNPSNGAFSLNLTLDGTHEVAVEVINTLGQVVYSTTPETVAARQYNISLDRVPAGVYQVRIRIDQEFMSRSIMIK